MNKADPRAHAPSPALPPSINETLPSPRFFHCPICAMPIGPYREELDEHYRIELKQLRDIALTADEKKKLKKQYYTNKYNSLPCAVKEAVALTPVPEIAADAPRTSKRQLLLKRKSAPATEPNASHPAKFARSELGLALKKKFQTLCKRHKSEFQTLKSSLPLLSLGSPTSTSALLLEASTSSQSENSVEAFHCFLCQDVVYGSLDDFNEHLDHCLHRSVLRTGHLRGSSDDPSLRWDDRAERDEPDEYEKEGVDIQNEDQEHYGQAQYSGTQLEQFSEAVNAEGIHSFDGGGDAPPSGENMEHSETLKNNDDVRIASATTTSALHQTLDSVPSSNATSNFIVQALKQRIQQLESAGTCVPKCQICLEAYKVPLVSVNCWHAHCEVCWMKSLAMKKVCPQCQVIVRPEELRKIYM